MKRFLHLAFLWALCSTSAFADGIFYINTGVGSGSGWSFAGEVLTINANGTYTITSTDGGKTSTKNRIKVNSGVTANITLAGMYLYPSGSSGIPFDMTGATVILTLAEGTVNKLYNTSTTGIAVPSDAKLTIQGAGTLTVPSGHGAAISGKTNGGACGEVVILSGTVTAASQWGGAGRALAVAVAMATTAELAVRSLLRAVQ